MPWTLLRLTDDLNDDGAWHGLERSDASAPTSTGDGSIFLPVGQGSGSAVVTGDLEIMVRVGWCTDAGSFVAGAGTSLTVEPVTIDQLPHPTNASQRIDVLSVGDAREASAWVPMYLRVGPAALVSVRLSSMVFASAARVAVWVWTRP